MADFTAEYQDDDIMDGPNRKLSTTTFKITDDGKATPLKGGKQLLNIAKLNTFAQDLKVTLKPFTFLVRNSAFNHESNKI